MDRQTHGVRIRNAFIFKRSHVHGHVSERHRFSYLSYDAATKEDIYLTYLKQRDE